MESILPEITKWLVYALIGWAVLIYLVTTFHVLSGDRDLAQAWVVPNSVYTCATLLMAAAIHLLFGT